jgi:hypothetical protein
VIGTEIRKKLGGKDLRQKDLRQKT